MKRFASILCVIFYLFTYTPWIYCKPDVVKSINVGNNSVLNSLKNATVPCTGGLANVFTNRNNFVFIHGGGLNSFKISEPNELYGFIDLQKINAYNFQGDIITDFYIDNNCKYAIIDNSLCFKDIAKEDRACMGMYFCNLSRSTARKISVRNGADIAESWSSNSRYFSFFDDNTKDLMLFDVRRA